LSKYGGVKSGEEFHLPHANSAIVPALLYLDFISDEILPPPPLGSPCIPAIARFFPNSPSLRCAVYTFQRFINNNRQITLGADSAEYNSAIVSFS